MSKVKFIVSGHFVINGHEFRIQQEIMTEEKEVQEIGEQLAKLPQADIAIHRNSDCCLIYGNRE